MKLYSQITGEGPDIVLIHGWGMNSAVWNSVERRLSKKYRVTRIELPGHGASEYDPQQSALTDWAEACLAVAPACAIWIGWSLGGQLAIQAALGAPERISMLVLIAASPKFTRDDSWHAAMPRETLKAFRQELANNSQQALERFLLLQVQGGDQARRVLRILRQAQQARPETDSAALAQGLTLLLTVDLRRALAQLRCRMLWLLGEQDTLVPGAVAQRLAGLKNGLREQMQTVILKGAAHVPFISHELESFNAIETFIGEAHG